MARQPGHPYMQLTSARTVANTNSTLGPPVLSTNERYKHTDSLVFT